MKQNLWISIFCVLVIFSCERKKNYHQNLKNQAHPPLQKIDSLAKQLFLSAKYEASLVLYKKILSDTTRPLASHAYAYEKIGDCNTRLGAFELAMENYTKALNLYEILHDTLSCAWILNHLGYVYYAKNPKSNGSIAMKYYHEALSKLRLLPSDQKSKKQLEGVLRLNVSVYYLDKCLYSLFFQEAYKALGIFESLKDSINCALVSTNLGIAYTELSHPNYELAQEYLHKAYAIYTAYHDLRGMSQTKRHLGYMYLKQNKEMMAEMSFEEALHFAVRTESLILIRDRKKDLAYFYKKIGKYHLALSYMESVIEYNEKIYNTIESKNMAEMTAKYEVEQKQKELALKNSQLKAKEEQEKRKDLIIIFVCIVFAIVVSNAYLLYKDKKKLKTLVNKLQVANQKIEHLHNNTLSSIHYARKIQDALLFHGIKKPSCISDFFIFFRPKDIVSGDFYWVHENPEYIIIAVADCTGHGVPGAFISILSYSLLQNLVVEKNITQPSKILDELHYQLIQSINNDDQGIKDSMEIVICTYDKKSFTLQFAGVRNSIYIVRKNELIEFKGDLYPIGNAFEEEFPGYQNHVFAMQKNDCIYLFSDGYKDQRGGNFEKKKGFGSNRFKIMLLNIASLPMSQQKRYLQRKFLEWKNTTEQYDDILVIGVKI